MTLRSAYFRKLLPVSRRKEFHLYLKNEKLSRIILYVVSLKTCKKNKFSKLADLRFTIGFSGLLLVFEQLYKIGKNNIISKFHFSRPLWFADKKIYGPRNTPETFWASFQRPYIALCLQTQAFQIHETLRLCCFIWSCKSVEREAF